MVYTQANKRAIQKWRENNKEKFTEYQRAFMGNYREIKKEEYREYMRNYMRKQKEQKDYYDDDKWWKILRKISV